MVTLLIERAERAGKVFHSASATVLIFAALPRRRISTLSEDMKIMLTLKTFIKIVGVFFISVGLSACGSPEELPNTLKSFARQEGESVNTPRSSCIAASESDPLLPDMKKWFPVKLPQTHSPDDCPTSKIQIVELRGWLADISGYTYDDSGFHYLLTLDTPGR